MWPNPADVELDPHPLVQAASGIRWKGASQRGRLSLHGLELGFEKAHLAAIDKLRLRQEQLFLALEVYVVLPGLETELDDADPPP